tara:strand:+ start:1256 stop:1462 length:207 start_codon:yes stop_codon:yes gene_type:complete
VSDLSIVLRLKEVESLLITAPYFEVDEIVVIQPLYDKNQQFNCTSRANNIESVVQQGELTVALQIRLY